MENINPCTQCKWYQNEVMCPHLNSSTLCDSYKPKTVIDNLKEWWKHVRLRSLPKA